jgi:hypothetical protein
VKMAADTASLFPPAIPGMVLMTAFTYVFKTFKDVSADYDRVLGFFNEMGRFLDTISMLEGHSPGLGPFERCVRSVFSSMLTICGIAVNYKVSLDQWPREHPHLPSNALSHNVAPQS